MKSIVVYYSLEGNTKYAAEKIAGMIGADLLELKPVKSYPTGKVGKFLWGGKSAVMAETPELEPDEFDTWTRFGFPWTAAPWRSPASAA